MSLKVIAACTTTRGGMTGGDSCFCNRIVEIAPFECLVCLGDGGRGRFACCTLESRRPPTQFHGPAEQSEEKQDKRVNFYMVYTHAMPRRLLHRIGWDGLCRPRHQTKERERERERKKGILTSSKTKIGPYETIGLQHKWGMVFTK